MRPIFPLFDFAVLFVPNVTQRAPLTIARTVISDPENILELVERNYRVYVDSCASESDLSPEAWMESIIEGQVDEGFAEEIAAENMPVLAQQWLDELPALLQRRNAGVSTD